MNQELPNLLPAFNWEKREAHTPPSRWGRLHALRPSGPIFEILPLDHGRGLRLAGELCLSTVGDLVAVFDSLPAGADVLDLADLSFMDSSGLHAVEEYARRLGSRRLVVLNASAQVRRLFELTGADRNPDIELRSDGRRG